MSTFSHRAMLASLVATACSTTSAVDPRPTAPTVAAAPTVARIGCERLTGLVGASERWGSGWLDLSAKEELGAFSATVRGRVGLR